MLVCGTFEIDVTVPRSIASGRGRLLALGCVLLFAQGCAARRPHPATPRPAPAQRVMTFVATAYCHGTTTSAGAGVRAGVVAADPTVLPLGTVIRLQHAGRYDGAYTVLDTGANVRGRRIDLFIRDCAEARRFGRRTVRVVIARR